MSSRVSGHVDIPGPTSPTRWLMPPVACSHFLAMVDTGSSATPIWPSGHSSQVLPEQILWAYQHEVLPCDCQSHRLHSTASMSAEASSKTAGLSASCSRTCLRHHCPARLTAEAYSHDSAHEAMDSIQERLQNQMHSFPLGVACNIAEELNRQSGCTFAPPYRGQQQPVYI